MLIDRFIKKQLARSTRKTENCFDHIISLGYNCEVAFRFLKYFNFEESNLFNWTFSYSVNDLIYALNNFSLIGTGDFEYPNPLFECKNTHIRFHGKAGMNMYINKTATAEQHKKDKEDLIGRIGYLKEKFLNYACSTDSKLYIYKLKDNDIDNEIENKIIGLYNSLKNLGAKNFKLLIVSKKNNFMKTIFENIKNPDIIHRTVKEFAADNNVTDKKYYDNGWDNIYNEFWQSKPDKQKKNKKYKFEEGYKCNL